MRFIVCVYVLSFLEGFTTLGVEVLAIRNVLHLVGSNIIITSTILGVIILALSVGYYGGGKLSGKMDKSGIIKRLCANLVIASLFYGFLSFFLEEVLLTFFLENIESYFLAVFLTSVIVFFFPVYLASQTVPLLSELLEHLKRGEAAGRILFFSTVGSFLGSILPVVFFVPWIGLNNTIFLIGILIFVGGAVFYFLYFKSFRIWHLIVGSFLVAAFFTVLNEEKGFAYSTHTVYNKVDIYQKDNIRTLSLNGNYSSTLDLDTGESSFNYIKEAEKLLVEKEPSKVLVIGAAGFSFPQQVSEYSFVEDVDVVDIDGALYDIAENHFLSGEISLKVDFFAQPGRYFINQVLKEQKKYDFVFVDVYNSKMSIPSHFLTKQFFADIFSLGDNVVFNFIIDKELDSDFAKSVRKTISAVREDVFYKDVYPDAETFYTNCIFSSFKSQGYQKIEYEGKGGEIYSDDRSGADIDKFKLFYKKIRLPQR